MITLYHAPLTRSLRVLWLLEELGLDYELRKMPFTPEALNDPDYRRHNPFGRVPAMIEGNMSLFESGAIVEYLLARHGEGRLVPPADSPLFGIYLQWFHFAEATLMPPLSAIAQHTVIRPEEERIQAVAAEGARSAGDMLAILDDALSDKTYILGDTFTAADIMLGYCLVLCEMFGLLGERTPHVSAYLARLKDRPALAAAMAA